jgi:uncharacterized protein (DUF4415 family)
VILSHQTGVRLPVALPELLSKINYLIFYYPYFIDTSDIPPLEEGFFSKAQIRMPKPKTTVTIRLDQDILGWFKAQGKGYQTRINAILRTYMKECKDHVRGKY